MQLEGAEPTGDPQRTGMPQSTWPTLHQISTIFPFSVVLTEAVPGNHSKSITIIATTSSSHINEKLRRTLDGLFGQMVGWRGEVKGVSAVRLLVLVAFEDGYAEAEVKRLRRYSRDSWNFGFTVTLNYTCLDVPRKRVSVPWWAFDDIAGACRAALYQVTTREPSETITPSRQHWNLGTLATVAATPFVDFWEGVKLLSRPYLAARRIANGDFRPVDALKYALASVVISDLIEKATHSESGLFGLTGLPVLDELLGSLTIGALTLSTAIVFYGSLRLAGGKGKFKHLFYATLIVSLAFIPMNCLISGLLRKDSSGPTFLFGWSSAVCLSKICGPLFGISSRRALWFTQGILVLIAVVVVIGAVKFF